MSLIASWVDGVAATQVPIDDRGLAYGDGVFETLVLQHGRPVWWQAHLDRLQHGALQLGLQPPAAAAWEADLAAATVAAAGIPRSVLKLMLTRGSGGRGYTPEPQQPPRRLVLLFQAPAMAPAAGLTAITASLRLAGQPRLAGCKHLNRLEQVLARQECLRQGVDEAILLDHRGRPCCATQGNLLLHRGGRWWTPPLAGAGIAGLCRAALIANGLVDEAELTRRQLDRANALVVCNSVRGILPLRSLDGRALPPLPELQSLQAALATLDPAFAAAECSA